MFYPYFPLGPDLKLLHTHENIKNVQFKYPEYRVPSTITLLDLYLFVSISN